MNTLAMLISASILAIAVSALLIYTAFKPIKPKTSKKKYHMPAKNRFLSLSATGALIIAMLILTIFVVMGANNGADIKQHRLGETLLYAFTDNPLKDGLSIESKLPDDLSMSIIILWSKNTEAQSLQVVGDLWKTMLGIEHAYWIEVESPNGAKILQRFSVDYAPSIIYIYDGEMAYSFEKLIYDLTGETNMRAVERAFHAYSGDRGIRELPVPHAEIEWSGENDD